MTAKEALRADFTLEYKNFQLTEKKSLRSPCFAADLWLNGSYAGWIKNDGTGGATVWLHPDEREQKAFIAWVATLPPMQGDRTGITFTATWEYVLCLVAISTQEYLALRKKVRRSDKFAYLELDDQFHWQQYTAPYSEMVQVTTRPNVCGVVTRFGASLKYDIWHNITLPILWHDTK